MTVKKLHNSPTIDFHLADTSTTLQLIDVGKIHAGFPSPAEEYLEERLDLNKALVKNPPATFVGRVKGNSMIDAGVYEGDILVVDKSLEPKNGDTAVCWLDGNYTLKTLRIDNTGVWLQPHNPAFKPIRVNPDQELIIWGIVTFIIHKTR